MILSTILSFLTYPGKNKDEDTLVEMTGAVIPVDDGKLCSMLKDIFDKSHATCDIPIIFTSAQGNQYNPVRDLIIDLMSNNSIEKSLPLAKKLQSVTSGTSGMGLLFFCIGDDGTNKRLVISRFPADEGVVAEKTAEKLTVQFVEQVFLKSAFSYKAVVYEGKFKEDFWSGHAVDKQINHGQKSIAAYWIVDFLESDFKTTSAAGTKRLASALKSSLTLTDDLSVKQEISSCVPLAKNMPSSATTIADFCDHFHLSEKAKALVCSQVKPVKLLNDKFQFDKDEFAKNISFKAIEMDNGAILSAQVDKFDECFQTIPDPNSSKVTIATTGKIVNERLRTVK